ncbi:MAG: hypothetical protein O7G83_12440 [Proteobacteria bacterium]|nr:hypothetical protein [Pseudomonadota bacterium]
MTVELKFFDKRTDVGNIRNRAFYRTCVTPISETTTGYPGQISITAGTPDDPRCAMLDAKEPALARERHLIEGVREGPEI